MTRAFTLFFGLGLCILTATPLLSSTVSGQCAAEEAKWSKAYADLQAGMDNYRKVKYESVTPRIARDMTAHEREPSIARVVQAVLQERSERLAELGRTCLELAQLERSAFDEWRGCATTGISRRENSAMANFRSISLERDRLIIELRDLLLDEAYIQYKNHRAPDAPASPSYEANQPSSIGYR